MCREERSRPHQGIRMMRLQEQEQDLHAEAASWKLLAALHGNQDLTYPGGLAGVGLQGCGKAMPTKQLAASLIAGELDLNRCINLGGISNYKRWLLDEPSGFLLAFIAGPPTMDIADTSSRARMGLTQRASGSTRYIIAICIYKP